MRIVAQRLGVLAAVALIALLVAFELAHKLGGSSTSPGSGNQAVPAPGSNWNVVHTGVLSLSEKGKQTACGVTIGTKTYGVASPSLPCGARVFIAYGHTQVLTEVLEQGPYVPGLELDLTPALAARLGIDAVTEVRWRFAR